MEAQAAAGLSPVVVLLGDYINRGPDSLGSLRRLAKPRRRARLSRAGAPRKPTISCSSTSCKGQPDERSALGRWLSAGGRQALSDFGIEPATKALSDISSLQAQLRDILGPDVIHFLSALEYAVQFGDWLFTHGGVDPSVALEKQDPASWISMREPFLSAKRWKHPFRVVHGHTIRRPEFLSHRLGLDTGCYRTGVLTAAELLPDALQLFAVSSKPKLAEFRALSGGEGEVAFGPLTPMDARQVPT